MKNLLFTTLILCIITLPLFADNDVNDAVYLNMLKEYTLNEDGSWNYHQTHQLKLLSYYAFNSRYGETFIVYDTLRQSLKINHCFSTMVDGQKVESPPNAFNLVLPRFARDAAIFNHLREMVVTHTGIEPGAVIDIDYQIHSKAGFLPAMMADEILLKDSPIKKLTVRINIPASETLHFKLLNNATAVNESKMDGRKIYEWSFMGLPAAYAETIQPLPGDLFPRLIFSAAQDWDAVYSYLASKIKTDDISDEAVAYSTKGADGNLDKIIKVQKTIVNEIAEFPVPAFFSIAQTRTPNQVWQSAGGTPLEKAILMSAILNKTGIMAKPVMVSSTDSAAADVPCFLQYDQVFVCAHPQENQKVFIAVQKLNDQSLIYDFNGHSALILADKIIQKTLPAAPSENNKCETKISVSLDSELNINGSAKIELQGATNPYLQIKRKPGKANFLFKGFKPDTCIIISTDMDKTEAKAELKEELTFREQGDYLFYKIPTQPYGVDALQIPALTAARSNPIQLPFAGLSEEFKFDMEIPDEWKIITPDVDIKKKNKYGEIKIKIDADDNEIEVYRYISLTRRDISAADYSDFLELWKLWMEPNYKLIIINKTP